MAKVLRPIGHEDRLSIVDHLDELRSRLIVCAIAVLAAFGLCFWQNHILLNALNEPLASVTASAPNHLGGLTKDNVKAARELKDLGQSLRGFADSSPSLTSTQRAYLLKASEDAGAAGRALPQKKPPNIPVTLGPGEPFTTTITVCFYAGLLLALPLLLYQLYAFVIPALEPEERGVARPLVIAAPALFIAGVVFTYIVVMPAAVRFLQGYNSSQFQNLVQAKPLYTFEVMTMGAIGLAFQLPLAMLGLHRLGVINGNTLIKHWRYATVILAIIAAAMPGADPVTTGLETLPLAILFIASIVLLKYADRRDARRAAAELAAMPPSTEVD